MIGYSRAFNELYGPKPIEGKSNMNERIKELALLANPASKEIYESDNWEYNCAAWCAQDLEKFAELIVRECANFLKDTLDDHFAAEQLEEHFDFDDSE